MLVSYLHGKIFLKFHIMTVESLKKYNQCYLIIGKSTNCKTHRHLLNMHCNPLRAVVTGVWDNPPRSTESLFVERYTYPVILLLLPLRKRSFTLKNESSWVSLFCAINSFFSVISWGNGNLYEQISRRAHLSNNFNKKYSSIEGNYTH